MKFPFEYCALRFLMQWLQKEENLHLQIRATPTISTLREALRYFQVARTFQGIKEFSKANVILTSLLKVRSADFLSPQGKVEALAEEFEREFEQLNISAASKLLWLSSRSPFIVYDSRAVKALKATYGCKFDKRDYAEFCHYWQAKYADHERKIDVAVARLPKARAFMPTFSLSNENLLTLVKERWFKERVFDIHLWELGLG